MSDKSIEDILAVIEFEKDDDQNKRSSSKIKVSAIAENTVIPESAIYNIH